MYYIYCTWHKLVSIQVTKPMIKFVTTGKKSNNNTLYIYTKFLSLSNNSQVLDMIQQTHHLIV